MRKSINVTEKVSCRKEEEGGGGGGGGEAIPVALVGWFCAAHVWSTSPVPVAESLSLLTTQWHRSVHQINTCLNTLATKTKQDPTKRLHAEDWNNWTYATEIAHTLVNTSTMSFFFFFIRCKLLKVSLCFQLLVPTITRDAGCLGACRWLHHLIAVHQVAVVLVSRLCIHNRDIWNDRN